MEFMVLAHRGASAYAPENTFASFYKAVEIGANGIETDLQITRDGVIFLFHDDKLDKKSDRKGTALDYEWKDLKEADVGSWFSPKYRGERLVTFEEFLFYFGRRDLFLAIELKAPFNEKQVHEVIRLIDAYKVRSKTALTSLIFDNLKATRNVDRSIRIGHLLTVKIDEGVINQLEAIGGEQICPKLGLTTAEQVKLARQHGLGVRPWGISSVELMQKALDLGVDGMTIDFPDKLIEALKKRA